MLANRLPSTSVDAIICFIKIMCQCQQSNFTQAASVRHTGVAGPAACGPRPPLLYGAGLVYGLRRYLWLTVEQITVSILHGIPLLHP